MPKILADVFLPTATDDLSVGGTIELGHASDTTLSRSAAGVLAVEGVDVVTTSATQTLTNKTLNKVAITAPATGATLTLAEGSTLATSGAFSTTLTATATTVATLPAGTKTLLAIDGSAASLTGLPISGITASTSAALGVGTIELGHASDTTIARVSAGVISVEGVTVPRLYSAALSGTASSFTVTHGLGAVWVTVMVYDVTTGKYIIPDHTITLSSGTPTGTVTITFPSSVTGSNYRVVITG